MGVVELVWAGHGTTIEQRVVGAAFPGVRYEDAEMAAAGAGRRVEGPDVPLLVLAAYQGGQGGHADVLAGCRRRRGGVAGMPAVAAGYGVRLGARRHGLRAAGSGDGLPVRGWSRVA